MMDNVRKIGRNMFEEGSSLSGNENYVLWKIRKNWETVVGNLNAENSEPYSLFKGKLIINVYNPVIYHSIVTYGNIIGDKVNLFLSRKIVDNVEIRKINRKKNHVLRLIKETSEEREHHNEFHEKEEHEGYMDEDTMADIYLTFQEKERIREAIEGIDDRYSHIAEKLSEIAKNNRIRDKYLLTKGFIQCRGCGNIFLPGNKNEKICPSCHEKAENEKMEKMKEILIKNPLISEGKAISMTGAERHVYYRARDILAQQAYNELLSFFLKKKDEIKDYEEYSHEIRNELKTDFEIYIKNFIDFRIGTDNKEIFLMERRRLIYRLKKEEEFRREKT